MAVVGIIVAVVVDGGDGVGGIIGGSVGNGDAPVIGVGVGGDGGVAADGVGVNVAVGGSVDSGIVLLVSATWNCLVPVTRLSSLAVVVLMF